MYCMPQSIKGKVNKYKYNNVCRKLDTNKEFSQFLCNLGFANNNDSHNEIEGRESETTLV
jgi:hypothetical protein